MSNSMCRGIGVGVYHCAHVTHKIKQEKKKSIQNNIVAFSWAHQVSKYQLSVSWHLHVLSAIESCAKVLHRALAAKLGPFHSIKSWLQFANKIRCIKYKNYSSVSQLFHPSLSIMHMPTYTCNQLSWLALNIRRFPHMKEEMPHTMLSW